jgi:uncharacterized membrane protein YbhN (UPF0104 family)
MRLAWLPLVAVGAVVVVPGLPGAVQRLGRGRPGWVVVAAVLELFSALGFVAVFHLSFGQRLSRAITSRMALSVLAATVLFPAGGLVAIAFGARAMARRGMPSARLAARGVAFVLVTNAPNLVVLGVLGLLLASGVLDGPHRLALTALPAAIALSAAGAALLVPFVSHQRRATSAPRAVFCRWVSAAVGQLEEGVIEARALLRRRSWKLVGALAYYAFDNAVLWAGFEAFGRSTPPLVVLVMAYVIGAVAGALPLPAGIGVVEGGLTGMLVLYGVPVACAAAAVLAYRAISTSVPLVLGGIASSGLRRHPELRDEPVGRDRAG